VRLSLRFWFSAMSTGSLYRSMSRGSMSTGSLGAVKGGGRMFAEDPFKHYTEQEVIAEGRERLMANKQRRRMKQLLNAASDDGATVLTKDLLLAAKLANMQIPDALIADTPFASGYDSVGVPTKIAWKPFYGSLPPPMIRGPGSFGTLPPLRKDRVVQHVEQRAVKKVEVSERMASSEEVAYWFAIIQNKMKDRFSEVRKAFRSLDADASGQLDPDEFKRMLEMFNLEKVPDLIISTIYKLTDFDGNGTISYAEFARLLTTDNVNDMKKTVSALDDSAMAAKAARVMAQGSTNVDKELGYNTKLRKTGPGLAKMRRFHATLRDILMAEFGEGEKGMKACYKMMDADGSGLVRRAEMRTFMKKFSKATPDNVISGIIDYVDTDGDSKTLSLAEWLKMMSADFLN